MDEYTWNTWNIKKIMAAINETSDNGLICFNMRYNGQDELERLNEHLFKKRPDLILRFSTENSNDLTLLPPLKNIRKLSLFNYESLNQIKNMRHLLFLEIYNTNGKVLDIGFFEELNNLIDLRLTAKVKNIEMLGKCESMESLYLSTTIENYNFTQTLNKLKIIYIDHCTASNDFTLLNKQMLEKISVTQINRLE
ncbi:MAG: hypothetical protein LBT33_06275, partial [Spirochaetia bacterium]|nr:hypothetical protein [Spirochaetia bacterium]